MKKVLITGGAGFIGSNFIRTLIKKNYSIVNVDVLTYCGRLENTHDFKDIENYRFYKNDICDTDKIKKIVKSEKPDILVNFAAQTHVDRSIGCAEEFVRTDILGVYSLLEACSCSSVELFIQISTDEVYGSIKKGYFSESSPISPSSPYSASKLGGEQLALSYFRTHGFPVIVVRGTNNYGPYQFPEKLIPRNILRLLNGMEAIVYHKGENIRNWIHVDDFCSGIFKVMQKGKIGEIYNIGTDEEFSNIKVIGMILDYLKLGKERIMYVGDRPGHDLRYAVMTEKIKDLDWSAKIKFEKGIKSTIKWYISNKKWWEPTLKEI